MKLTQILHKQHIGRQIRHMWYRQGKRIPQDYHSEKALLARGVEICDPKDLLKPKREPIEYCHLTRNYTLHFQAQIVLSRSTLSPYSFSQFMTHTVQPQPLPEDENHPDWKDRPCLEYGDNDLLVEGLGQAQHLTKTVVFENILPNSVEALTEDVTKQTNELVKRYTS